MRSVSEQIVLFALMVTLGIIIGIIFDFYRALRGVIEPGKAFTIIGDIIFWLVTTGIVFGVLMWKTWGEVRSYVLIGLIIGFLIHWYYFSPYAIKLFRIVIDFTIWVGRIVWRIVSWPFITVKKFLVVPALYFLALGRASGKVIIQKKSKCSNFVKNFAKKIFTKPPDNQ